MAGLTEDEELELELETAKAKAEQDSNLEAEIKARQVPQTQQAPMQDNSSLPMQEHYVDKVLPEGTPSFVKDAAHVAENVLYPTPWMTGLAKGAVNAGIGTLQTANAVGHTIGASLGRGYDAVAPSVGLSPRDPESVKAASAQADREQKMFQDNTLQPKTQEERVLMPVGQVGAAVMAGGGVGGAVSKALPAGGGVVGAAGRGLAGLATGSAAGAAPFPQQEGLFVRSDGIIGMGINPDDDASTQQTKKFFNQATENMILSAAGEGAYALGKKGVEVTKNIYNGLTNWNKLSDIQQQAAEDVLSVYAKLGEHPTAEQQQKAAQEVIDLIDEHGVDTYNFGEGVGEKTVKKDTISTINSNLDESNPFDRAVKTRMEALRASAKRGNAPKTAVQLEEPERVLNEGLQEAQTARGGSTAIEQTRQNLQDRAQQEAAQLDVPVQTAKEDLVKQSSDYTDVIRNDPTFGPAVKEAEQGGVPLDINAKERELKGTIVSKAGAAQETDKAIRDSAYKAVAETNTPAKMDEFMSVYEKHKDTLPTNIQQLVDKADGSYGYLYKEVRPRLSQAIDAAYKNQTDATGLMALKRNIDQDQMAWLADQGNNVTADLAKKAAQANREYSVKWNDTIGAELRVNKNNNRFAPGRLQEKGRDIVDAAISNPNRKESIDNLRAILGPEGEGLISDTALAKATKDITAGKGANFDQVTEKLQQYANSFGPQQKARLEGFLTDLKNKKITLEELGAKIPELEKAAAAEKEALFGERFPTLFENAGGKKLPKSNGYAVFEDAMNAKEPRVMDALIKEAKKTPGDLEGIQTAWLKSAESKINASSKQVGKLDEGFIENGKKIFGEGSPEVEAITSLRDTAAKLEESLNKPGMEGLSATENQTKFRTMLSMVNTWVFGVLNPTAARVRTITSNLAESYNSTSKSHEAIDTILSDNQAMRSAMENLIKKSKSKMSPAQWKQLWTAGAKIGLYAERPTSNLSFQTEQAMGKDKHSFNETDKPFQVADDYPSGIDNALSAYDSGKITAKMLKEQIRSHGFEVDGGLNTKYGIKIYPIGGGKVIYTG